MDQLNLLQTSEEKAYESIKPSLVEVLEDNGLDESYLTFEVRKNFVVKDLPLIHFLLFF